MRPRRSTAILGVVWIATLALYVFVKPDTTGPEGTPPLVQTTSAILRGNH
ncbi:hypothetical protein [Nocardia paucivorans]|nr:hypothetical protein [Nocardia paucivorans]